MEATSFSRHEFWSLFGNTPLANYTQYSNEYQLDGYKISLITGYFSLFVIGTCGNGWVAIVIGRLLLHGMRRGKGANSKCGTAKWPRQSPPLNNVTQTPLHIYIFALCCCDLIVLCFVLLLIMDLIHGRWVVDSSTFLCQLYLSIESVNKFCGPFLLASLSGYCYFRVCKNGSKTSRGTPTSTLSIDPAIRSPRRAGIGFTNTMLRTRSSLIIIAVCICLMFILVIPVYLYADVYYLILYNSTFVFSVTPKCAIQPAENVLTAFTAYTFVCGYVVPASLFTFFYACIMRKAWTQTKLRQDLQTRITGLGSNRRHSVNQRPSKTYLSRVVKTTLGLVLFYLCCWTPYWAMSLYRYTIPHDQQGQSTHTGVLLSYFVHALPYVNCSGYPILYTVLNKTIKESSRRITNMKKEGDSMSSFLNRGQSQNNTLTINWTRTAVLHSC